MTPGTSQSQSTQMCALHAATPAISAQANARSGPGGAGADAAGGGQDEQRKPAEGQQRADQPGLGQELQRHAVRLEHLQRLSR